jgi:hypothetical protein
MGQREIAKKFNELEKTSLCSNTCELAQLTKPLGKEKMEI